MPTAYRTTRRERQSKESRELILDATIRILATRGLVDTTIRNVAKEAGISQGSIYHFFDSREGLMEAVVQELRSRIETPIREALQAGGDDVRRQIVALIDATIRVAREHPGLYRAVNVLQTDSTLMPVVYRAMAQAPDYASLGQSYRVGLALLRRAVEKGVVKPISALYFIDYLSASVQGAIIRAGLHGPNFDSAPLFAMVRKGVLAVLGIEAEDGRQD